MASMDEPEPLSAATPSAPTDAEPHDPELATLRTHLTALEQQGRAGASWFYWVGGLSLVNSAIMLFGGGIAFVFGLGITSIADDFGADVVRQNPQIATVVKGLVFGFDLFVVAIFAGLGWLANKRYTAAFAFGMVLYFLDGLLFVRAQSWISVAFHGFALFQMWHGLRAFRQINRTLKTSLA